MDTGDASAGAPLQRVLKAGFRRDRASCRCCRTARPEAGVTRAILYRHLESKADLYRAVLDQAVRVRLPRRRRGRSRATSRTYAWSWPRATRLEAARTSSIWPDGRAAQLPRRTQEWLVYAFDPSERPKVGIRSRERTAVARTEDGVVREVARCLTERWPRCSTRLTAHRSTSGSRNGEG
jgi:AcrR family transcriptional regulator